MSLLEALWLGIVQGLTEFLPVSSSGHLVMVQSWLGSQPGGDLVFEVAVHGATWFAIVLFYRARLLELARGVLGGEADSWRYTSKLAVATLPAVAVGLLARGRVEAAFETPAVVGVGLIVTGGLLWTTRWSEPRARLLEPGWGAAVVIGFAQAMAILPGISRSGSTVAVALALGVAPLVAAEFSFLLGVIAIAGASVLVLPDAVASGSLSWPTISMAFAAAFISGLAALRFFVWLLERRAFYLFAYYDWAAGSAFLAWLFFTG